MLVLGSLRHAHTMIRVFRRRRFAIRTRLDVHVERRPVGGPQLERQSIEPARELWRRDGLDRGEVGNAGEEAFHLRRVRTASTRARVDGVPMGEEFRKGQTLRLRQCAARRGSPHLV